MPPFSTGTVIRADWLNTVDVGTLGVATIADIRALTHRPPWIFVHGFDAPGDGGGGLFRRNDNANAERIDDSSLNIMTAQGDLYQAVFETLSIARFGILPHGDATLNSVRLQNAAAWASPRQRRLWVPSGRYTFAAPIVKAMSFQGLMLEGESAGSAVFDYSALPADTSFITLIGGSGALTHDVIKHITFVGHATSCAVEFQGQCGQRIVSCVFDTNKVGVSFNNKLPGHFTEYCTVESSEFRATCILPVQYQKAAGDRSFHGCGLAQRCLVNTGTDSGALKTVLRIQPDCLPYNSPLDVQVWASQNTVIIEDLNSDSNLNNSHFHGTVTVETFGSARTVLGSGNRRLFLTGHTTSINEKFSLGTCHLSSAFTAQEDGSFQTASVPSRITQEGVTNNTVIDLNNNGWSFSRDFCTFKITLVGSNYRFTHVCAASLDLGQGGGSIVTIMTTLQAYNVSQWGPCTFALNDDGTLVVRNTHPDFLVSANIHLLA